MADDVHIQEPNETPGAKAFAMAYAARSGVTVEFLKENGMEPWPCDCGEKICEGWQMARRCEWCGQFACRPWACPKFPAALPVDQA